MFILGSLLPGDPGRSTLGPLAPESAVKALDHQYGTDKPLLTQYWLFISHFVRGDMGTSNSYHAAVRPLLFTALGTLAQARDPGVRHRGAARHLRRRVRGTARRQGARPDDHGRRAVGDRDPRVRLGDLPDRRVRDLAERAPVSATRPAGAGIGTQIYHLILPAIPLVLVLFGYIARMARAGTVEALESDYVRTAVLKGLPRGTVIRRHVLRNSLLPTITVIASQTGYLIGGLFVVETLFHYNGVGTLLLQAATQKDYPDARGRSSHDRRHLHGGDARRRPSVLALNPRIRYQGLE